MTTRVVRRPIRRLDTTPQRILSLGLASAACIGLVGVIGVRSAQDTAAAAVESGTPVNAAESTSSAGLTQADLDAYAAQLEAERARLNDYRKQLVAFASDLQTAARVSAPKAVKKSKATTKSAAKSQATRPQAAQAQPQAAQAQPQAEVAQPAKEAPKAKAAPQVQAPQAQTRSS